MSKYNKKIVDIICSTLKGLNSKTAAAESAGISLVTFFEWYNTKPEFKQRIDSTMEETLDRIKAIAVQSIVKNMETDWRAAQFFLERRFPEEYGKRDALDIDVTEKKIIFKIGLNDPDMNITFNDINQKQIEE